MKQRTLRRIDLHTHSVASPDGGITLAQYRRAIDTGRLDAIAVTDHNTIDYARIIQAELGQDRIIVGEEIHTTEGELIGLYLREAVPARLGLRETVDRIRAQGGIVYVPHPFETLRHGIQAAALERIKADIDIIEVQNGRAVFQNRGKQARNWAALGDAVAAASSDAHSALGWGRTYSQISSMPTQDTLVALLREATYAGRFPGISALMAPKYNRFKKRLYHV